MNNLTEHELIRHNLTLNPCPNCKSVNIRIDGDDFDGDAMCVDCKLITPICYGTKGAILTWNKANNWKNWEFLTGGYDDISDLDRLNWLQSGHSIVCFRNKDNELVFSADFDQESPNCHKNVRIAIDKAINRENARKTNETQT